MRRYSAGETYVQTTTELRTMDRPKLPVRCMFCFGKIYRGRQQRMRLAYMVRWDGRHIRVHWICLRLSMLYQSLAEYSPAKPQLIKPVIYKPPPNTVAGKVIRG